MLTRQTKRTDVDRRGSAMPSLSRPGLRLRFLLSNVTRGCRVQTKHLDVVDVESADLLSHLPDLCDFIDEARQGGGVVYVHCAAGVSRSATVRAP